MPETRMQCISAGSNNSLWATTAVDGTVCRRSGDAGFVGWVPDQSGKAQVIANVDFTTAFCVNGAGEIWHIGLTDESKNAFDSKWMKVPTHSGINDAAAIAVGPKGTIWYAQTDGMLFHRDSISNDHPWVQDPSGRAVAITVGNLNEEEVVYCVNAAGEIWKMQNNNWSQIATYSGKPDAKSIAAGVEGGLWYTDTSSNIYFYLHAGAYDGWIKDLAWNTTKMGNAVLVSVVTHYQVFCLTDRGEVWQTDLSEYAEPFTETGRHWSQVVDRGPEGKTWNYTVKPGDTLLEIVRHEFKLTKPTDAQRVNWIVDSIVSYNKMNIAHLTRDHIEVGDQLTMHQ